MGWTSGFPELTETLFLMQVYSLESVTNKIIKVSFVKFPDTFHRLQIERYLQLSFEPRHEKTSFNHMRTTKVQISLRICAV